MSDRGLTRILHVDDEPDIREIVRIALTMIGRYTVESCASGPQAVARALTFDPDLILLDVMMPGMTGPETLAALRAPPTDVLAPVVFMTATASAAEIEALHALGAADVIAKPFDPLAVPAQLGAIWARHAGRHGDR